MRTNAVVMKSVFNLIGEHDEFLRFLCTDDRDFPSHAVGVLDAASHCTTQIDVARTIQAFLIYHYDNENVIRELRGFLSRRSNNKQMPHLWIYAATILSLLGAAAFIYENVQSLEGRSFNQQVEISLGGIISAYVCDSRGGSQEGLMSLDQLKGALSTEIAHYVGKKAYGSEAEIETRRALLFSTLRVANAEGVTGGARYILEQIVHSGLSSMSLDAQLHLIAGALKDPSTINTAVTRGKSGSAHSQPS